MRLVLGFSDIRLRTYFNKLMILLPNFVEFTLISLRKVEHFLNPLFGRLFYENKIIRNHMNNNLFLSSMKNFSKQLYSNYYSDVFLFS